MLVFTEFLENAVKPASNKLFGITTKYTEDDDDGDDEDAEVDDYVVDTQDDDMTMMLKML